ncbi:heme/hemin ABC transporter substrate-binding protein [Psychromarinibacter sp. S121]|uniref:heme/hemin ABC transporter substrate-binding protein n=1 Tax=Psychromarinibacter sp. S121 TaxID=3415127 RepID=UPI003C7E595F
MTFLKSELSIPAILGACLMLPVLAFTSTYSVAEDVPPGERVLSVGGSVTEIIYALGEEDRLVARDTTSSYPPEVMDLPDVGYMRALSPEGVLSVNPDLVIAEAGSGPPETIEVLEEAAIDFVAVPDGFDRDTVRAKIEAVAAALDVVEKGEALAAEVDAALADAMSAEVPGTPKRVMFVLTAQGGRIMASGTNTTADGIIRLAGAVNAVEGFEGYKPVSEEAIIAAAPDVILMMDRGGDHAMTDDDLFALPSVAATPAGETRSVVRIDGLLLLGFGPRTPEAVRTLHGALYGGA